MPHDAATGLLLNPFDYKLFVQGIQSGNPADFQRTPLGPANPPLVPDVPSRERITPETDDRTGAWESNVAKNLVPNPNAGANDKGARVRAWESAGAGNVFDLEGPDAQAVTMPPAPRFDSDELLAEIVEVYAMALLRDDPFSSFPLPAGSKRRKDKSSPAACVDPKDFARATKLLRSLDWFNADPDDLSDEERARRRSLESNGSNLFRGVTPGEQVGPYLSQFLLLGNNSLARSCRSRRRPVRSLSSLVPCYLPTAAGHATATGLPLSTDWKIASSVAMLCSLCSVGMGYGAPCNAASANASRFARTVSIDS